MLEIKNLHSGYGELKVLKGVDINVKEKEIVALIGPNGAGKSTVIRSVFNIANVTKGDINFNGKNIRKLKTHELIKKGIFVPIGDGSNYFHTIYVKNLVDALILTSVNKNAVGEDFIIGNDPCPTMKEIWSGMHKELGKQIVCRV